MIRSTHRRGTVLMDLAALSLSEVADPVENSLSIDLHLISQGIPPQDHEEKWQ